MSDEDCAEAGAPILGVDALSAGAEIEVGFRIPPAPGTPVFRLRDPIPFLATVAPPASPEVDDGGIGPFLAGVIPLAAAVGGADFGGAIFRAPPTPGSPDLTLRAPIPFLVVGAESFRLALYVSLDRLSEELAGAGATAVEALATRGDNLRVAAGAADLGAGLRTMVAVPRFLDAGGGVGGGGGAENLT